VRLAAAPEVGHIMLPEEHFHVFSGYQKQWKHAICFVEVHEKSPERIFGMLYAALFWSTAPMSFLLDSSIISCLSFVRLVFG
jgi:hypothetical protein